MILEAVISIGPWAWLIAGLVLLGLEIVVPGNVFVWFGVAAILIGLLAMFGDLGWQIELIAFAVLSLVLVLAGRRYFSRRPASDEPFLNERAGGIVGRRFVLTEPIVDGNGRIRIDDTNWLVNGPDLPSGTRIRIVGTDGTVLRAARDDA